MRLSRKDAKVRKENTSPFPPSLSLSPQNLRSLRLTPRASRLPPHACLLTHYASRLTPA